MASSKNAMILYYSRTGNCRAVAEAIGETLSCPVQGIKDLKNRAGFWGFISGMIDIRKRPLTEIEPKTVDLSPYDTIFLGSPIWGMRFAPAITTVLERFNFTGKNIVLFAVVTGKFRQAQIDSYGQALSAKGARVTGSFVLKTRKKTASLLKDEAKTALRNISLEKA
jgi:flavodoxin